MQKLESAHKKIVYRDSEILALRAEKDFVWSQFNKLDSDYADLRKSKTIELEQAYEIIENLELDIKHLQASASEKNSIMVWRSNAIAALEDQINDQWLKSFLLNRFWEDAQVIKNYPLLQDWNFQNHRLQCRPVREILSWPCNQWSEIYKKECWNWLSKKKG